MRMGGITGKEGGGMKMTDGTGLSRHHSMTCNRTNKAVYSSCDLLPILHPPRTTIKTSRMRRNGRARAGMMTRSSGCARPAPRCDTRRSLLPETIRPRNKMDGCAAGSSACLTPSARATTCDALDTWHAQRVHVLQVQWPK